MRQHKYRFWDPFNEVMTYSKASLVLFFKLYARAVAGGNAPALMEWTGVVDRYGQEIFEGDIVKVWRRRGLGFRYIGTFVVKERVGY